MQNPNWQHVNFKLHMQLFGFLHICDIHIFVILRNVIFMVLLAVKVTERTSTKAI